MGGTSVAGPAGLTGGRGEEIKVPVGPQTVTVVRPCPLPLPSLAPHPISGGQAEGSRNPKGSACAVRVVLPFWSHRPLFSVSLLVDCAVHRPRLSEFLRLSPSASTLLVLPWALCVTVDCAECSCGFNELLWVAPYLRLPLPSSRRQPLGRRCVCPNLCFSLCPPCSHPPCIAPPLQAVLCGLPSDQSWLKPAFLPKAWMPVYRQEMELELGGSWNGERRKRRGKGPSTQNQESQNCLLGSEVQRERDT